MKFPGPKAGDYTEESGLAAIASGPDYAPSPASACKYAR